MLRNNLQLDPFLPVSATFHQLHTAFMKWKSVRILLFSCAEIKETWESYQKLMPAKISRLHRSLPWEEYCCGYPDDFRGVAAPIRIGLLEQYTPFISFIACDLSLSSPNLTKPYPFERPVLASMTTLAALTEGYFLEKVSCSKVSVTSAAKSPTKMERSEPLFARLSPMLNVAQFRRKGCSTLGIVMQEYVCRTFSADACVKNSTKPYPSEKPVCLLRITLMEATCTNKSHISWQENHEVKYSIPPFSQMEKSVLGGQWVNS